MSKEENKMSRIYETLKNKKSFIPFLTAGDPSLEKTEEFIIKMAEAGAALVEIGIPFSDPIAEGPVIQDANVRALSAPGGCTTDMVFDMVERVSKKVNVPLVFLTYLNPIFKYGPEKFCKRCSEVGIDGLIVPDMPFEEKEEIHQAAKANGVDIISLIAPTSDDRIQMIAKEAEGYIYVVSSMGVTGVRSEITTDVRSIVEKIKAVTDVPVAIGFGIHEPAQVSEFTKYADGAIVGSAIVKIIAANGENSAEPVYEYVKKMVDALS